MCTSRLLKLLSKPLTYLHSLAATIDMDKYASATFEECKASDFAFEVCQTLSSGDRVGFGMDKKQDGYLVHMRDEKAFSTLYLDEKNGFPYMYKMAVIPDRPFICTWRSLNNASSQSITIWDMQARCYVANFVIGNHIKQVCFLNKDILIVQVSGNNFQAWNLNNLQKPARLFTFMTPTVGRSLVSFPNRGLIAMAHDDASITIGEVSADNRFSEIRAIRSKPEVIIDRIAVTHDENFLLVGYTDVEFYLSIYDLRDPKNPRLIVTLEVESPVSAFCVVPDTSLIVTCHQNNLIQLWDVRGLDKPLLSERANFAGIAFDEISLTPDFHIITNTNHEIIIPILQNLCIQSRNQYFKILDDELPSLLTFPQKGLHRLVIDFLKHEKEYPYPSLFTPAIPRPIADSKLALIDSKQMDAKSKPG